MHDPTGAKRWVGLAVASLLLAGMLSLLLVVGRLPGLDAAFTDPLFFRRCLVVHVDLALIVWFYSFLTALFLLVPTRSPSGSSHTIPNRTGSVVAFLGVAAMVFAAGVPDAAPVLANYVPVVDTPLFVAGLLVFGLGVAISLAFTGRLLPGSEEREGFFLVPPSARIGLRGAALAFLLAGLTFGASALVTSPGLTADVYYELVAWGGGHVLQFANVAGMLAAWSILIGQATGRDPVGRRTASVLFTILVAPLLAAPLVAFGGTTHAANRELFTDLMRWGIFPVVLVYLGLCVRSLVRARRDGRLVRVRREPHAIAFAASAGLTVAGFALGAMIRGSNTVVPAHYHASIGAVTVAYMAVTYPLLRAWRMRLPSGRLAGLVKWQPALFGAGQLVFALGFGLAGAHGMARKVYGAEQHVRTAGEWLGLGVMGVGGVVAVVGGLSFLGVVVRAWLARPEAVAQTNEGGVSWNPIPESIRSRG